MTDETQTAPVADADADAAAVASDAVAAAPDDAAAAVTAEGAETVAGGDDTVTGGDAAAAAPEKPAKKAKAKPIDLDALPSLIDMISNRNISGLRDDLIDQLRADHGAKITDANYTYSVKLAGLEVSATAGFGVALANWCNKARRALNGAED